MSRFQPWKAGEATEIHVTRSFGRQEKVDVPRGQGDHDGGDARLRELIFRRVDVPEYLRLPGSRAGAMSCLTGIAARKSIEERRAIRIADLVRF